MSFIETTSFENYYVSQMTVSIIDATLKSLVETFHDPLSDFNDTFTASIILVFSSLCSILLAPQADNRSEVTSFTVQLFWRLVFNSLMKLSQG